MTKIDDLATYGQALYGAHWAAPLAKALNVNERNLRRWLAGTADPPPGIIDDLRALVRQKISELEALA